METKKLTIVMYHYVRELQYTRFPKINGLLTSQFKEQLEYIGKYYSFVTVEECLNAIYSNTNLPKNAVLLTFDDGYLDQYVNVFPILHSKGIQGCFFPPAKAILNNEVLDVNKIHFIIASVPNVDNLVSDVYKYLDKYRSEYCLESNKYYFSKLAKDFRFDPKEIIFIKRLLQVELGQEVRKLILDELFHKYVSNDEGAFSNELYMNINQLRLLVRNGMYVGGHGFNHYWLNTLLPEQQENEINLTIEFLEELGAPTENWVMCYPYGSYNKSLIKILKGKNCKLALTTNVDIASINKENAYTLQRLDTNDLPIVNSAQPNAWTKKVLN